MAAVKVKTGPIAADDPARDVPPEKWFNLMLARRSAVHVRIPYDCRSLLNYVSEAEEFRMWEQTGHADLQAYIRDGLNVDPELLEWAKLGLASFESGKPVPLATAVEAGKKAAQTMEQAHVLAESRRPTKEEQANKVDNIKLIQGGTSAAYLASRIKRDAPEIAERVMAGEFKSIRQAAIAAGIVKEPTALMIAQRAWKRMTEDEQRDFLRWISTDAEEAA